MNIKRITAALSAALVMTFSIAATPVFAAEDVNEKPAVTETSDTNLFTDTDSLKGAKTWDNSDSMAAIYAVASIAAFGVAMAVAKSQKKAVAEKETDSDKE